MDEKRYHTLADATLARLFDQLDAAYESGALDELELEGGILTILAPSRRTYLLTKHAPTQQLWYASPILGGLHFSYDATTEQWRLPDGRALSDILRGELASEQIEVVL